MVVSLRGERVPPNLIVLKTLNNTLPANFTHNCCFNARHIKGTPNGCTNPGVTAGANTHTHAASAAHCHPVPGTNPHTHPFSIHTPVTGPGGCGSPNPPNPFNLKNHPHAWPAGTSTDAAPVTINNNPNPDHTCSNQEPTFVQTKFVEKSTALDIRSNTLPFASISLWDCPNACIPSCYGINTAFFSRYPKGTANACTAPGCTGGSATHQHPVGGCHTHPGTLTAHIHTVTAGTSATAPVFASPIEPGSFGMTGSHTHTAGPLGFGCSPAPFTSGPSGTHQHPTGCNDPLNKTVAYLQRNVINLRKRPVQENLISLWLQPLACIPSGYTNETSYFTRYPKSIVNACTCPGPTGGLTTHTHGSLGAHTHTFCKPHGHPATGASSSASGSTAGATAGSSNAAPCHTHGGIIGTLALCGTSGSCGSHCHGTATTEVSSITVAYIKKSV